MKKQFKTSVLAIALLVSTIGAFATGMANAPKAADPAYNWNRFAKDGSPLPGYTNKTRAEVIAMTGCNGSLQLCASATTPGVPQINYN